MRENGLYWDRRALLAAVLVLGVCCYLAFFYQMSAPPIDNWDEARVATNAAEMYTSGNWLVTQFGSAPDLWNTKPPLLIWMQAALLGTGLSPEAAIRTPSAVAATLVVLGALLFCHVGLRNTVAGFAAGLILVTSRGFTGYHVGRNGDYDAMLALWVATYLVAYFVYLETTSGRRKTAAFAVFAVSVLCAVLTKSVAGLIGIPALFLYTLAKGRLLPVLRDWRTYAGIGLVVAGLAAFFVLRERAAPGYWAAVVANDLTGRYSSVIEDHVGGPGYYVVEFAEWRFVPWVYLLPLALLVVNVPPRDRQSRFLLYALTFAGFVLLILSTSGTKIVWYDAQLYLPLALVLGIVFSRGVAAALTWQGESVAARAVGAGRRLVPAAALLLAFGLPVMGNLVYYQRYAFWNNAGVDPQRRYGQFFDYLRTRHNWRDLQVVDSGFENTAGLVDYNAVLQFHRVLENASGAAITVAKVDSIDARRPVVTCDSATRSKLNQPARVRWVDRWNSCTVGFPVGLPGSSSALAAVPAAAGTAGREP